MNDKRNLTCGNVMLLSQSHDETSLFAFAKKIGLREKINFLSVSSRLVVTTTEENVVRLGGKKINFDLKIAG